MPHQFVLIYLPSKAHFVFNQMLFTLFKERYAVVTPLNFFWRPFWKSYSLTKAKFYLANLSNLAKTKKTHWSITPEQEINPVQIPHPSKTTFKFSPSRAQYTVKFLEYAQAEGRGDVEETLLREIPTSDMALKQRLKTDEMATNDTKMDWNCDSNKYKRKYNI